MKNAVDEYQRLAAASMRSGKSVRQVCIEEGVSPSYYSPFGYIAYLSNLAATLRRSDVLTRAEGIALSHVGPDNQDRIIGYVLSRDHVGMYRIRNDRVEAIRAICERFPQVVHNTNPWTIKLLVDPVPFETWQSHVWTNEELGLPDADIPAPAAAATMLPERSDRTGHPCITTEHGSVTIVREAGVDQVVFDRIVGEHREFCSESFTQQELEQFHASLRFENHRVLITSFAERSYVVTVSYVAAPVMDNAAQFRKVREGITEDYRAIADHSENGVLPPELSAILFGGDFFGQCEGLIRRQPRSGRAEHAEPRPAEPRPAKPPVEPELTPSAMPVFRPAAAGINNQRVQAVAWILARINTLAHHLLNIPGTMMEEVTYHPGDFERLQAMAVSGADTLSKFETILATVRSFHST